MDSRIQISQTDNWGSPTIYSYSIDRGNLRLTETNRIIERPFTRYQQSYCYSLPGDTDRGIGTCSRTNNHDRKANRARNAGTRLANTVFTSVLATRRIIDSQGLPPLSRLGDQPLPTGLQSQGIEQKRLTRPPRQRLERRGYYLQDMRYQEQIWNEGTDRYLQPLLGEDHIEGNGFHQTSHLVHATGRLSSIEFNLQRESQKQRHGNRVGSSQGGLLLEQQLDRLYQFIHLERHLTGCAATATRSWNLESSL